MNSQKNYKFNKNVKIFNKNNTKNAFFLLIFFIFLSFFLLILTTLAFFSSTNSASGSITLGELDFIIYENQLQQNSVLPNGSLGKTVSIINSRNASGTNYQNLCPFLFRFDFDVFVNDEIDEDLKERIILVQNANQYVFDSNYYYFLNVLNQNQTVNLCNAINFDSSIGNEYQGKDINIVFYVDAIQSENGAYQEVWLDAPDEWVEQISALL